MSVLKIHLVFQNTAIAFYGLLVEMEPTTPKPPEPPIVNGSAASILPESIDGDNSQFYGMLIR